MSESHNEQIYGNNQPSPTVHTPSPSGDPARDGAAAIQAALAEQRDREGYAPGEGTQADDRQRFGSLTSLDKLKAEAAKDITNVHEMEIPGDYRPGWSFVIDCLITGDQLERYTDQSRRGKGKGANADINAAQLNARILINHVKEIRENGNALEDDRGNPIRLSSREFIGAMGETTAMGALRKFVWDSHIAHLADAVMDAAGYSRDGSTFVESHKVDPTHG